MNLEQEIKDMQQRYISRFNNEELSNHDKSSLIEAVSTIALLRGFELGEAHAINKQIVHLKLDDVQLEKIMLPLEHIATKL